MVTLALDVYPPAPTWQQDLAIAEAAYGRPPCGLPVIVWRGDEPGPADEAARALGGYTAEAWVSGLASADCTIYVRWSFRADLCPIVVHEWRHLLGQAHDPTGVTGPRPGLDDGPCPPWWRRVYVPFRAWDAATSGGWGF